MTPLADTGPATPEERPRLLLVDDDAMMRAWLGGLLRPRFDLTVARHGLEALGLLADGPFAVVMSDFCMPGMDGAALLAEVRERDAEAARVLITGSASLDAAVAAINRGHVFRFVHKPCTPEELLATAEAALEHHRVQRSEHLMLHRALAGSVQALARAVDAKDDATQAHSGRVAALARLLARALGWDAAAAQALHDAGLVHDVGKIGIPDRILRKPGRLTDEEYAAVKEHATLGAAIVREVLTDDQVAWVRHHHERHDGRGYPDGLAGDDIPAGARILALADAFDVMTSARPYSAPRPTADALAECRSQAGGQFDPEVVRALERVAAEGLLCPSAPAAEAARAA